MIDDTPTARTDSDTVTEGASTDGNVLTGTGTKAAPAVPAPIPRARTAIRLAAAWSAFAPAAMSPRRRLAALGAPIVGLYGTLTLSAGGGYTYVVERQ